MLIDDASNNVLSSKRGSPVVFQRPRLKIAASHAGRMLVDDAASNVLSCVSRTRLNIAAPHEGFMLIDDASRKVSIAAVLRFLRVNARD